MATTTAASRKKATTKTTVIPDGAKKPQDHKSAQAEAQGKPIPFEYGGHTYHIAPDTARDVDLMEWVGELQDGHMVRLPQIMKRMIGEAEYQAFKDRARDQVTGRVDVNDLTGMWEAASEALGNSAASPGS